MQYDNAQYRDWIWKQFERSTYTEGQKKDVVEKWMDSGFDPKSRTMEMLASEFGIPGAQIFARKCLTKGCGEHRK